ncbi:MAG: hypothetical protein L3J67_10350 [Hyphomicrobiaceae bacterium]|nr:hypothetical protein [Hyphomicrobiaceae bacterium]
MLRVAIFGLLSVSIFAFGTVAGAVSYELHLAKRGQTLQQCKGAADVKMESCLWKHPLCKAGYKDECKQQCRYDRNDAYAKCKKKKG